MLVIEQNYDKEKLVTEWGFKQNEAFENIYTKIIDEDKEYFCKIMIKDNILYFYYNDDLDRLIHIDYDTDLIWQGRYKITGVYCEQLDYEVQIPDIIFDMIKEGIIIKKENK